MIHGLVHALGAPRGGSAGPALAYASVVIILGDSQASGTTSAGEQTTAIASYTVNSKVKALNAAGAWVTYTPGTLTGLAFGVDNGQVGSEMQFIKRFVATYPNDTLYVIKQAASGSFQGRGPTTGNVTASITSNILTPTVGVGEGNYLITGTGVQAGTYMLFSAGGSDFYVGDIGGTGYTGGAVASTVMAKYNATLSWSSTEGTSYNGYSGSITNGARGYILAGLAAIPAGLPARIIGVAYMLGTNDASTSTTANAFAAAQSTFFTRINSDLTLTNAKVVQVRIGTGAAPADTVRAAMLAAKTTQVRMVDTDSYTRWDGTHYDLAGLNGIGNGLYEIVINGGSGD